MPYDIELPDGQLVEVPDGVEPKAALAKIKSSKTYGHLFKNERGGFGRAAVAGLINTGLGSLDNAIGQGVGKWLDRPDIADNYARRRGELADVAAGIYTPTTDEHVAAAKKEGRLAGMKAYADKGIIEPVGGVLGGMVPVLGATAVGGPAAGMGVALAQNASETMDRYVEQGKPVDAKTAWVTSLPMAAIDVFTASRLLTGAGAVEKAREAAARVAPKVLAGEMTRDQAIKAVRSTAKNMLSEMGKTATLGAVGENAQTVLGRTVAGQSLTDEGARQEYWDNTKTMAVIGGVGGAVHGARAKGAAVRNEIDPAVQQYNANEIERAQTEQALQERMAAEATMGPDRRMDAGEEYTGPERRGMPPLPAVSDVGPDRRTPSPYQGDQFIGPDRRAPGAPSVDRRQPGAPQAFVDGVDRRFESNPLDYLDTTPREVVLPEAPGQRSVEPPPGFVPFDQAQSSRNPSPFADNKGPTGPTIGYDWDSNTPKPDMVNAPVAEPTRPELELTPPPVETPVVQDRRAADVQPAPALTSSAQFADMVRPQAPAYKKLAGKDLNDPAQVKEVVKILKAYRKNVVSVANATPENNARIEKMDGTIAALEDLLAQKQQDIPLKGGKNVKAVANQPAAVISSIDAVRPDAEPANDQDSQNPNSGGLDPIASVPDMGVRDQQPAVAGELAGAGIEGRGIPDGPAGTDVQGARQQPAALTDPAMTESLAEMAAFTPADTTPTVTMKPRTALSYGGEEFGGRATRQQALEANLPENGYYADHKGADNDRSAMRKAVKSGDIAKVADRLAASKNPIVSRIGAEAKKITGVYMKNDAVEGSYYAPSSSILSIADGDERTAAHELVHVLAHQAIDSPTPQQKIHVKRMTELYDFVRAQYLKQRGMGPDEFNAMVRDGKVVASAAHEHFNYAFINMHEFVSEGFSNAAFQRYLANTKYQNKTAWSKFVETVARLLGLKNDNALTEFLAAGTNMLEADRRAGQTDGSVLRLHQYPGTPQAEPNRGPLESAVQGAKSILQTPKGDLASRLKNFGDSIEQNLFDVNWGAMRFLPRAWTKKVAGQIRATGLALMDMAPYSAQLAETSFSRGGIERNAEGIFGVVDDPANNLFELSKRAESIGINDFNAIIQNLAYAERVDKLEAQKQRATAIINQQRVNIKNASKLQGKQAHKEIARAKKVIAEMNAILNTDFARPANVTDQSMANAKADLAADARVQEAVAINKAVNLQNIKLLEQGGIITPETADLWRQNSHYVPMQRVMDEDIIANVSRNSQTVQKIKKFEGSERDIGDVLDNLKRQRLMAAEAAMLNTARAETLNELANLPNNDAGVHKYTARPSGAKNIVAVKEGGVDVFYTVDDTMAYKTFLGVKNSIDSSAMKTLEKVTHIFRNSLILSPGFILKAMFRDNLEAWNYGNSSGSLPGIMARSYGQFVKELPMMVKDMRRGKPLHTHHAVTRFGVTGHREATSLDYEINKLMRSGSAAGNNWAAQGDSFVKKGWAAWEAVASEAEIAVRNQVFQDALARTGSTTEAALAAMNTLNFRRRGASSVITAGKMLVPFFNSSLQGLYRVYRALGRGDSMGIRNENARRMLAIQGTKMLVASSIMAAMLADDEDYKDVPVQDKVANMVLPLGDGTHVKMPLHFELGTIFWAMPQQLIAYFNGDADGQELKKALQMMVKHNLPPILPQAVTPVMENVANYSTFRGTALENAAVQRMEPGMRVNDHTSGVAAEVGAAANMSPIKIQNILDGYFGSLGNFALQVVDATLGLNADKPATATNRLPFISNFVVDPNRSRARDGIYELKKMSDRVYSSAKDLEADGKLDELQDYLDKKSPMGAPNRALLEYHDDVNQIAKVFTDLRKMEDAIKANPNLSREEKRAQIDVLKQKAKAFSMEIEPRIKEAFSQ